MKKYLIVFVLCVSLIFLVACATDGVSSDTPSPDNINLTNVSTPEEKTNTDDNLLEKDHAEKIELLPCIDNRMTFTSLSEVKAQITALQALDTSDTEYATYSALNADNIQTYYQPSLPEEFELVSVDLTPFLMIYNYEIPGRTGIVYVQISRIQEEDPLLDIETVTKQGRWKGYIFTGNTNWSDLYFSTSDGCLVKVSASRALLKELGLDNDEWKALENICSLENIQTVHISTTHVTE